MYDSKMAARVWERVQSGQSGPELGTLLQDALALAHTYGQLAAKNPPHRKVLLTLRQETLDMTREMNGLLYLEQGKRLTAKAPAASSNCTLRQCCQRELEWAAACGARRQDPRYGAVYAQWEAQAQRHCRTVLGLLGNP